MGKEGKKKPLKSLITFSSPAIYARALGEGNTSALVEALLARHYGLDIVGNSVQAQLRRHVFAQLPPLANSGLKLKVLTGTSLPAPVDELSGEDGDLDDSAPGELSLPPAPSAETGVPVPKAPVDTAPLPDRPGTTLAPVQPSFAPASMKVSPAVQPLETATAVADPPTEPASRLCPNCGNSMGTSPHCLNCL